MYLQYSNQDLVQDSRISDACIEKRLLINKFRQCGQTTTFTQRHSTAPMFGKVIVHMYLYFTVL